MSVLYLALKSVWCKSYNCPQQKEFCGLFLQKEMTEFWYGECWQIAESAAHLSLDWQFNHQKCTARLRSEEQRRRNWSFSKALKDESKFEMCTLLAGGGSDMMGDTVAQLVVVSRIYRFFFIYSESADQFSA